MYLLLVVVFLLFYLVLPNFLSLSLAGVAWFLKYIPFAIRKKIDMLN